MSFDALAWAAKQNTGSSGTKLVLLGLAECADRSHALAFPSVAALVEFSSLDRKSVIGNLTKLEESGFIRDTGRKVGKTGQIKVYQLIIETVPEKVSQKRNSSDFSGNSPKNGTRNKSEPVIIGDTSVSPRERGKHILPKDWKLPAIEALPPKAQALAKQWTPESYETQGEAFENFWRGNGRMMKDWDATWARRIVDIHSKVMQDHKHGNGPPSQSAPAKPFDQAEYDARLARIGRQESTGPPRTVGSVVDGIVRRAGNG